MSFKASIWTLTVTWPRARCWGLYNRWIEEESVRNSLRQYTSVASNRFILEPSRKETIYCKPKTGNTWLESNARHLFLFCFVFYKNTFNWFLWLISPRILTLWPHPPERCVFCSHKSLLTLKKRPLVASTAPKCVSCRRNLMFSCTFFFFSHRRCGLSGFLLKNKDRR